MLIVLFMTGQSRSLCTSRLQIVVTVLFNGGTVQYLLEYYNLIELDEQPHNRDFDQEENRRPSMAVDGDAHDGHSRLLRHQISNMQVNSSMTLRSLRHQHTISERPPQRRCVDTCCTHAHMLVYIQIIDRRTAFTPICWHRHVI